MGDIVNFSDRRAELRRRALFGELKLVPKIERSFRAPASQAPPPDGAANDPDGDETS